MQTTLYKDCRRNLSSTFPQGLKIINKYWGHRSRNDSKIQVSEKKRVFHFYTREFLLQTRCWLTKEHRAFKLHNINNFINLNVPCHRELQGRLILVGWPGSYRPGSLNKTPLRFFSLSATPRMTFITVPKTTWPMQRTSVSVGPSSVQENIMVWVKITTYATLVTYNLMTCI